MPALSLRAQIIPTIAVYILGLGGMAVIEICVAMYAPREEIAAWAAIKASLFVAIPICLLGLDQVLVRNPSRSKSIATISLLLIVAISGLVSIALNASGLVNEIWKGWACLTLLASSVLFAAYYRAHSSMIKAQIATNLWRFFAAIAIVALFFLGLERDYLLIISLSILIALALAARFNKNPIPSRHSLADSEQSTSEYFRVGSRFLAGGFLLNAALHLDQILLNLDGEVLASANYFQHTTLFLLPVVFASGFIGFYLGPLLRNNFTQAQLRIKEMWPWLVSAAFGYAILSTVVMSFLFQPVYGDSAQLSFHLVLPLAFVGTLRLLYSVPSAGLNVYAPTRLLDLNLILSAIGFLVQIFLYFGLTRSQVPADEAVAISSAGHWLTKTGGGWFCLYCAIRKAPSQSNQNI